MIESEVIRYGGTILVIAGVFGALVTLWKALQLTLRSANISPRTSDGALVPGVPDLIKAWAELLKAISGLQPWLAVLAAGMAMLYLVGVFKP